MYTAVASSVRVVRCRAGSQSASPTCTSRADDTAELAHLLTALAASRMLDLGHGKPGVRICPFHVEPAQPPYAVSAFAGT